MVANQTRNVTEVDQRLMKKWVNSMRKLTPSQKQWSQS